MPALIAPTRFFLGKGTGGSLYRLGSAGTDDGALVAARVESQRFAPGGIAGEAIFVALTVFITYTGGVTLKFTPIVDDVIYDGSAGAGANAAVQVILATPTTGYRVRAVKDLGLSIPYIRDSVDRGRFGLRGTWFQLRAEVTSAIANDSLGNPGVVILEGYELEYEPVGVTKEAVASPAYP